MQSSAATQRSVATAKAEREAGERRAFVRWVGGAVVCVFACVLLAIFVSLCTLGCNSPPAETADHGVSNASYRSVVVQSEVNVAQIESKLAELKQDAVANQGTGGLVARPGSWWAAELLEAQEARKLLHGTLQGATK